LNRRSLCINFHIFKNAGTSIDWILEKNFGKDAIRLDIGGHRDFLSWEQVFEHLKNRPHVKSFSSHQIRFPLPKCAEFLLLSIVFIRPPIASAFSIFSFNKKRRDVDDNIDTMKANTLQLKDYIKWNLEQKRLGVMKDYQVRYLCDKGRGSLVDRNDLELAVSRIKNSSIIGIVDRFDESAVVAEETLKPYFENIDLSYVKKNVNSDRTGSLSDRLQKGLEDLGQDLMDKLKSVNELDLELYSLTNQELDRRKQSLDKFDEKLVNFRNRC